MKAFILALSTAFVLSVTGPNVSANALVTNSQASQSKTEHILSSSYKKELASYKSRLRKIASTEKRILDTYGSVTGANYTDDLTTYNTMVDLVPTVNQFIASIEKIQPKNDKIYKTHKLYIDAWNLQYEGFVMIIAALENQDFAQMSRANSLLSKGRSKMTEFTRAMSRL
jgi:hypothetical protein